jgi:hypothetical protein
VLLCSLVLMLAVVEVRHPHSQDSATLLLRCKVQEDPLLFEDSGYHCSSERATATGSLARTPLQPKILAMLRPPTAYYQYDYSQLEDERASQSKRDLPSSANSRTRPNRWRATVLKTPSLAHSEARGLLEELKNGANDPPLCAKD